MVNKDYH